MASDCARVWNIMIWATWIQTEHAKCRPAANRDSYGRINWHRTRNSL